MERDHVQGHVHVSFKAQDNSVKRVTEAEIRTVIEPCGEIADVAIKRHSISARVFFYFILFFV